MPCGLASVTMPKHACCNLSCICASLCLLAPGELDITAKRVHSILMFLQDTGLDQEANDAAARVAGVGGDREDRYTTSSYISCVIPLCPAV